jgi:hypothetical protein
MLEVNPKNEVIIARRSETMTKKSRRRKILDRFVPRDDDLILAVLFLLIISHDEGRRLDFRHKTC